MGRGLLLDPIGLFSVDVEERSSTPETKVASTLPYWRKPHHQAAAMDMMTQFEIDCPLLPRGILLKYRTNSRECR